MIALAEIVVRVIQGRSPLGCSRNRSSGSLSGYKRDAASAAATGSEWQGECVQHHVSSWGSSTRWECPWAKKSTGHPRAAEAERTEIDVYRRFGDPYGYVFYVARRTE